MALSGGGLRASLFSLGALVAVFDAGLWAEVRWIASSSGGSFTNALAAVALPASASEENFAKVLRHAVFVAGKGLGRIALKQLVPALCKGSPVGGAYERAIIRYLNVSGSSVGTLAESAGSGRGAIFVAVDLTRLRPVFLTSDGVVLPSSDVASAGHDVPGNDWAAQDPGSFRLAAAVRASASFPGLPAVRVTAKSFGDSGEPLSGTSYLADGGIWDNLAASWSHYRNSARSDVLKSVERPCFRDVDLAISVDASAPVVGDPRRKWALPVLGMKRCVDALVESSLEAQRRSFDSRATAGFAPTDTGRSAEREAVRPLLLREDISNIPYIRYPNNNAYFGVSRAEWSAIAGATSGTSTVASTFGGIDRQLAVHLLAHGYANVMASLVQAGVAGIDLFGTDAHSRIVCLLGGS